VQVTYELLRRYRVPLWLRSDEALQAVIEALARGVYAMSGKEPFSAVLPYLMLGLSRLPVLRNIFRLAPNQQKVYAFLCNDFALDRCVSQ